MFNKKITEKDKTEIATFVATKIADVNKRIDSVIFGADFNGEVAGEIMNFLMEDSGYKFYQETGVWTPKELKSLGKYKEFVVKGVKFIIAKKDKVEGKTKKLKVKSSKSKK
jgi:hypothetical protein